MKDPDKAIEIVRAVRAAINVPLTVKMRSGFDQNQRNAPELAYMCQEEGAEAITIHWRTREDRYGGSRAIDKIAETKSRLSIPVIANGDIIDSRTAIQMLQDTQCDGLMIGRGAIRNPWVFQEIKATLLGETFIPPTRHERRYILEQFIDRYREDFRSEKHSLGKIKQIVKYFYNGLTNGEQLRMSILRSKTIDEIETHIQHFFGSDA
jgi:tRNA-dihydrouridine synthase